MNGILYSAKVSATLASPAAIHVANAGVVRLSASHQPRGLSEFRPYFRLGVCFIPPGFGPHEQAPVALVIVARLVFCLARKRIPARHGSCPDVGSISLLERPGMMTEHRCVFCPTVYRKLYMIVGRRVAGVGCLQAARILLRHISRDGRFRESALAS